VKRTPRFTRWEAGAVVAVPVALSGLGVPAVAGAVLVVLIVVVAICWTIMDTARSRRLAMLIRTVRRAPSRRA
jgi:hypothetical protein